MTSYFDALVAANELNIMFRKDKSRSLSNLNPFPVSASWRGILHVDDWQARRDRFEDIEYRVVVTNATTDTQYTTAYVKEKDHHVTVETRIREIRAEVTCDMPSFSDFKHESVMSELQNVFRFEDDEDNRFIQNVKMSFKHECLMLADYPVKVEIESITKVRVKVIMPTECRPRGWSQKPEYRPFNPEIFWATMDGSGVFNEVIDVLS